ncbi:MAG TPA: ferredoxin reductase [Actinomycetota bacterium]|nr:ferredoxin reductase [Actinomycetota bacterium]
MARAAIQRRLSWTLGEVVELIDETPRVRSVVLDAPEWPGHLPGQHVDIRLTAEDGYQAQRSYSIASAPENERLMLTVEMLPHGEVSSYLVGELRVGDELELRGPIGGYFVWEVTRGGPVLLVAGGSGIVPLMSMIRHRAKKPIVAARLLYSSRSFEDIIFREELARLRDRADGLDVIHTLTRTHPHGWEGYARRVDAEMLAETAWPPDTGAATYVCGPTPFVEAAGRALVLLGHDPRTIRTERFGPTGG